jgi:para-aminobenzoate synthetase component I
MMQKEVNRLIAGLVLKLRKIGPVVLLDSQLPGHRSSEKVLLAGMPRSVLSFRGEPANAFTDGAHVAVDGPASRNVLPDGMQPGAPWEQLRQFRNAVGGWVIGYLGYDLKNYTEKLVSQNPDEIGAPDIWFMNPGILIRIDTGSGAVEWLWGDADQLDEAVMTMDSAGDDSLAVEGEPIRIGPLNPGMSFEEYTDAVIEAKRRIAEGVFYEINLTSQLSADFRGDSWALYEAMREAGPVPFAAYMAGIAGADGAIDVCCSSPERFLARTGSRVVSEPIKGTIAASGNEQEDRNAIRRLNDSEKDRAENLMIVDLVRNDLSRIARKGSVKVDSLFEIQSFRTVHQMVSTISAEVDEQTDPVDIIKACYPMGSMTGAPKISAMLSIEELENYRRGIYSGAIGYIDDKGDFDFNVVIRTAVISNNRLYYCTGGAVTGDSDPKSEWEESRVKARALLSVFENQTNCRFQK